MDKKTCLLIGRFQPFHTGHYKVTNFLLSLFDELKVGIGDIENNSFFTLEERVEMIKMLTPAKKVKIYSIKDLKPEDEFYNSWGRYVESAVGKFDFVAGGPDARYLYTDFLSINYPIIIFPKRFYKISGTLVRKRITDRDSSWEKYVTPDVKNIIRDSMFYKRRYQQ